MEKNKGLEKNVILLGFVSFLNDISSEMIIPLLPLLLSSFGATGLIIGLVAGFRDSISSILKVVFGYISDKTGKRKIFVFSGYATSAIFKFFIAFSKTWSSLLIFSGLERIGKGIRAAPRDAIISESMPKTKGEGFGIDQAFDKAGAILGSLLVFLLMWLAKFDFKTIILIAGFIAIISLIPIWFVKEQKAKPNGHIKINFKNLSKPLKMFIIFSALFAFANFSYMFFILKAQTAFPGNYSLIIPIILYVWYNLFYAGLAIPFGKLSDKVGRIKVILFGASLFLITLIGFTVFKSLAAFIILFAFYGIANTIIEVNQKAVVSDLSTKKLRATALGTFHTAIGIVALPAGLLAGMFWKLNPVLTFIYGVVVTFIAIILFIIFTKKWKKQAQ